MRADLREVGTRHGLKLAQVEALTYLAMANRYSDTPIGLTEYLGVTKGTVSQTLIALEKKGFVDKVPDERDRRIVHCHLTAAGKAVAREAMPAGALRQLDDDSCAEAAAALRTLLGQVQRANEGRAFGVCETCAHFRREARGFRCGLTHEPLTRPESLQLCREHTGDAV